MKRLFVMMMAAVLAVFFAACSGEEAVEETVGESNANETEFVLSNDKSVELGAPESALNPEKIYDSISYTPEMFFGDYKLYGGQNAEKEYAETASYLEYTIKGETKMLTTVPIAFCAGKKNLQHKISLADGYNWAQVSYMRKVSTGEKVLDYFYCAYEVDGNKLIVKPLDDFQIDDTNEKITVDFSDEVMTYDFAFRGRMLTLSNGEDSIELNGALNAYGEYDYFVGYAYVSPDSKRIEDFYCFDYLYDADRGNKSFVVSGERERNNRTAIGKFDEDGLLTFTLTVDGQSKTYQYVYFYGKYDGLVLTDGTDTFYYNLDYSEYHKQDMSKYVSEEQEGLLDSIEESKLEGIVEKTEDLLADLMESFENAGIQVTVDSKNGELAIDASVLFGGDSAELSADGKAFLDKFVSVYTSIIFSDKYEGFISKTIIEGHTAPLRDSTYESGLALSQERADVVKDYCLSVQTEDGKTMPETALKAVGMSNSTPIMDANGEVDLQASRRVSFKFVINIQ